MKKIKYILTEIVIIIILLNINVFAGWKTVPVCVKDSDALFPASEKSIAYGKYNGTLICWLQETDNGSLWIQKLDVLGNAVWTVGGIQADSDLGYGFTADSDYPLIYSDNEGGAVIIYRKMFFEREDIYVKRIHSDGGHLTDPVCISTPFRGYNYSPSAVLTHDNKIVVTWENFFEGDFNIQAQKIDMEGRKIWGNGEVEVCNIGGDQRKPSIACSEENDVMIAWLDARNYTEYRFDLYANILNSDGQSPGYPEKGILIFRNAAASSARKDMVYYHNVICSEKNSFTLALESSFDNQYSSVKVINVNNVLERNWMLDLSSGSFQFNPIITAARDGGVCVVWNDSGSNHDEVMYALINKYGKTMPGSSMRKIISNDEGKHPYTRIIPYIQNRNGIYTYNDKVFVNWVTTNSDKLFLTSISLADESAQCEEALEIQNNISEGEYTSVTAHDNIIAAVYKQSNYIFATVRNPSGTDFRNSESNPKLENFPNPFNPSTKIYYTIPSDGFVRLSVFDITGKLIRTLVNEFKVSGNYDAEFQGESLSSGIYFCRLEASGVDRTTRMTMLK